jgi:hypothetical protein
MKVIDYNTLTKGEIMRIVFTEDELKNIDVNTPHEPENPRSWFWCVMDYNVQSVFGEIVDMRERARERGIIFSDSIKQL